MPRLIHCRLNGGPAKKAIVEFVRITTEKGSPRFVPPEARIATFDQDGTTWVEQPIPTQLVYYLERVPAVVEKKPDLKNIEPFKTVLSGNREALAKLTIPDIDMILAATLTGMTVDEFNSRNRSLLLRLTCGVLPLVLLIIERKVVLPPKS